MSGSRKIMDEKLWGIMKEKWEDMKFDPILLSPVEYWAKIRGQTPFEVFLTVAHRALVGGIEV